MATKFIEIRSSPGVCTEIEAEVIRAPAITSPRCSAPDVLSVSRAVRSVMAGGSAPGSSVCVYGPDPVVAHVPPMMARRKLVIAPFS
jgi:hypothetical protein